MESPKLILSWCPSQEGLRHLMIARRRIVISGVADFECYEWGDRIRNRPGGCDVTAPALPACSAIRSFCHPLLAGHHQGMYYLVVKETGAHLKHSGARGVPTTPSGNLRSALGCSSPDKNPSAYPRRHQSGIFQGEEYLIADLVSDPCSSLPYDRLATQPL